MIVGYVTALLIYIYCTNLQLLLRLLPFVPGRCDAAATAGAVVILASPPRSSVQPKAEMAGITPNAHVLNTRPGLAHQQNYSQAQTAVCTFVRMGV